MNIPAIEYTIEGIIKRKIPVYNTTITINGTILSNEFVRIFRYGAEKLYQIVVSRKQEQDLLDKLHDWRNFEVNVSTDHWHDIGLSYQAYQFYCGAFKDDLIFVGIVDSADDSDVVKYKGRAEFIPGVKKVSESSKCRLNIPKVEPEDLIVCPLMITANGHIINDCSNINMTYKDQDDPDNIIGNIMDESLDQMIDRWQQEHMMTCIEEQKLNDCKTAILNDSSTPDQEAYIETLDQVLINRKFYLDHMPKVPFEIIQVLLPDNGTDYITGKQQKVINFLCRLYDISEHDMRRIRNIFEKFSNGEISEKEFRELIDACFNPAVKAYVTLDQISDKVNNIIQSISQKDNSDSGAVDAWKILFPIDKKAYEKDSFDKLEQKYQTYNQIRK